MSIEAAALLICAVALILNSYVLSKFLGNTRPQEEDDSPAVKLDADAGPPAWRSADPYIQGQPQVPIMQPRVNYPDERRPGGWV